MILLLLLSIPILWMTFTTILKTTTKKREKKNFIVFDDMSSHVMSDKNAQQMLKELFIRCNSFPKDVRLNYTHYIIFKLNNKRELQNIAINHSADIDYKDFVKIYRDCTIEPYIFFDY